MKKYSWSYDYDQERWDSETYDTIEDCILDASDKETLKDYAERNAENIPTKVYIGENIQYSVSVDAATVLENIECDMVDFCVIGNDYSLFCSKKDEKILEELNQELTNVVNKWLKKHSREPVFWKIVDVKGYDLFI